MASYPYITRIRRIMFWFFVLVFVVTWPLLMLYTFGISIQPDRKTPVVRTGIVSVESLPGRADLFVNGKDEKKTTPAVIENLNPGTYSLELRKEGFESWQAEVSIFADSVTKVDKAVLLRSVAQKTEGLDAVHNLPAASASGAVVAAGDYILFTGDLPSDFRAYVPEQNTVLTISGTSVSYLSRPVKRVEKADEGRGIFLLLGDKSIDGVLQLQFGRNAMSLKDVTGEFEQLPDRIVWYAPYLGTIYSLSGHTLYATRELAETGERKVASRIVGTGRVEGTFFYLTHQGDVGQITSLGLHTEVRTLSSPQAHAAIQEAEASGEEIRLVFASRDAVAWLGAGNVLYVESDGGTYEYPGIAWALGDTRRNRLVAMQGTRIISISLEERTVNNGRPQPWECVAWDNAVANPVPVHHLSSLLVTQGDRILLVPVLYHVKGAVRTVGSRSAPERYFYAESSGILTTVNRETGTVRSRQIVDTAGLLNLEPLE